MKQWQRYLAELFGTFVLVFGGCTAIAAALKRRHARPVRSRRRRRERHRAHQLSRSGSASRCWRPLRVRARSPAGTSTRPSRSGSSSTGGLSFEDLLGYWIFQFAGAILASLLMLIPFNHDVVKATATVPGVERVRRSSSRSRSPRSSCSSSCSRRRASASAAPRSSRSRSRCSRSTSRRSRSAARRSTPRGRSARRSSGGVDGFWVYVVGPAAGRSSRGSSTPSSSRATRTSATTCGASGTRCGLRRRSLRPKRRSSGRLGESDSKRQERAAPAARSSTASIRSAWILTSCARRPRGRPGSGTAGARRHARPPAIASSSSGSTRTPASGVTNSGGPPTAVATTGRPHAIASSSAWPNGSTRLGWQTTSLAPMSSGMRPCGTAPRSVTRGLPSSCGRSGPSPANVSVPSSRRLKASASRTTFFRSVRPPDAQVGRPALASGARAAGAGSARGRRRCRSPRSCRARPGPRLELAPEVVRDGDDRSGAPHDVAVSRRHPAERADVADVLAVRGDDERRAGGERGDQPGGTRKCA